MYKVATTHESQTNKAKYDLSSTGMNDTSSVRRPMNRDSHVKNSVLANSKKPAKKVEVYFRKNKQIDIISENVIYNKENVIDVDVANASKAKTLLCVSCMQNVLIPCHDYCFANYKLNVHLNVRRTLSNKSRTPKSYDTTYVVYKTRFSKESTLSKSLDTTYVVSKPKIDVGSTSKANDKHMTGDRSLLKNFIEKFMGTVRFGKDNFAAITGYGDYIQGNITICHVYYVEGDDLLTGGRESNLYTIFISNMATSSPVCLMSKATSIKSCLNMEKITFVLLVKEEKSKKASHSLKLVPSDLSKLELLHMDLCGPMRQNGVVERRNRTLVEAAHTMLIFSRLPEFLWAEAVATACFTQNRSIIHTRHNKTPYELLRGRKPNVEYFHVFGSLCYPTNDRDDLGKMKPKADIGVFIGYSETSRGFRIYNRRTKKIMETINVKFDELTAMASEHDCLEPELQRFINHNSSAEEMNTPSKEDLDNLFGPMFEEYFEKTFSDTPINSAAQPTQIHEDSPSTSSIIVDEHEAPPIVTTSDEQTSPISLTEADEFNQEDSAHSDGNSQFVSYNPPSHEEIESSTTALEPSNV
ncbi:retrovirus-related pol polyprotein from transposon TNT 1-94 [Tanacetum coccineum]